jgi:hypothetical protein
LDCISVHIQEEYRIAAAYLESKGIKWCDSLDTPEDVLIELEE